MNRRQLVQAYLLSWLAWLNPWHWLRRTRGAQAETKPSESSVIYLPGSKVGLLLGGLPFHTRQGTMDHVLLHYLVAPSTVMRDFLQRFGSVPPLPLDDLVLRLPGGHLVGMHRPCLIQLGCSVASSDMMIAQNLGLYTACFGNLQEISPEQQGLLNSGQAWHLHVEQPSTPQEPGILTLVSGRRLSCNR